ncbi:terpene synthase family protein [Streptomyces sp. OZ13]|uniref:terpene synthase family protein n=1 Tax=Streptomyces sp. OZ13 TaxID=3452210 RepID=UPI003F8BDD5D
MLSADLRPAEVRHSCFGHVLATLIEPCAGLDLPDPVHHCEPVRQLIHGTARLWGWTNDVYSFPMERHRLNTRPRRCRSSWPRSTACPCPKPSPRPAACATRRRTRPTALSGRIAHPLPDSGPRRPRLRQPGQGALSESDERIAATTAIYGAGELLLGPVLMIGGALEEMRTMPSLGRYCAKCD